LNATACETMPHCGMILASVRNSFFRREFSLIARNYTVRGRTVRRESQVGEDAKFNESMGL
jgi:hypothetical protein